MKKILTIMIALAVLSFTASKASANGFGGASFSHVSYSGVGFRVAPVPVDPCGGVVGTPSFAFRSTGFYGAGGGFSNVNVVVGNGFRGGFGGRFRGGFGGGERFRFRGGFRR